jgi:succinate-semialdehyde dehydrogenase / glutarate-semialdehyde dehydrogenase
MYEEFGLFIDNAWCSARGEKTVEVIDPATEDVLGAVPRADGADLDDALAAASRAAKSWAATAGWARSKILRRIAAELESRRDRIATSMSAETGKPIAEAQGETGAAIDQFDWYADEARRIFGHTLDGRDPGVRLEVRYQPVGSVAAFTAWNFPALLPARKIAAALAAGCTVILKPSEEAPASAFLIAEAALAAGLPSGVLNVVTGDPAMISAHLIASPVIRKVSLTGSVPVGKHILKLCADGVKKVSMELGGHAPVLVFEDADPVAAGLACARAKFRNAGQVCISPTRFYVHSTIYEPFAKAMADYASGLKLGRGLDSRTECGPMVNRRGRDRMIRLVEDARQKGAEVLAGGGAPTDRNRGFFFQPTVLGRVSDAAAIMHEEPFGPVAPIAAFDAFDEVVARANDVPFGLAGYVFSRSLETAAKAADALEVAMVGVNDMLLATAEAPFGGVKQSGMGREGGQLGVFDYLEPKYTKLRFALS